MAVLEEKIAETYYRRMKRTNDPISLDDVPAKVRPYVEKLLEESQGDK